MSSPFKRFLSAFMAIVMFVSMVPTQAFAASVDGDRGETLVSADLFNLDFVAQTEAEQMGESTDGPAKNVNLEFPAFYGRVTDMYGQGMSDVSIQIYDLDENAVLALCYTDQSGAWASSEVDTTTGHTCIVRFYKAGYTFSGNLLEYVAMPGENNMGDVIAIPAGVETAVCNEDDYLFSVIGEAAVITGYTGHDPAIITPTVLGGYPVVGIGAQAFQDNTEIEAVYLSNCVATIGNSAFVGCIALMEVTFPNGLQSIGDYAFAGCTELVGIEIPKGIFVSEKAFDTENEECLPASVSDIKSPAENGEDEISPDLEENPMDSDEISLMAINANSITDTQVFMTYPQYLWNENAMDVTKRSMDLCFDVFSSQSSVNTTIATAMTIWKNGSDIALQTVTSSLGWDDTYEESILRSATEKFLGTLPQSVDLSSDTLNTISRILGEANKSASAAKEDGVAIMAEMFSELRGYGKSYAEELSGEIWDAVSDAMEGASTAPDIYKFCIGLVTIESYRYLQIQTLMDRIDSSSDLYHGLSLVKVRMNDPADYCINQLLVYCAGKIEKNLIKAAEELLTNGGSVSSVEIAIYKFAKKMFFDYVYEGYTVDSYAEAVYMTSFAQTLEFNIRDRCGQFVAKNASAADIASFKELYNIWIGGQIGALNSCAKLLSVTNHMFGSFFCLHSVPSEQLTLLCVLCPRSGWNNLWFNGWAWYQFVDRAHSGKENRSGAVYPHSTTPPLTFHLAWCSA